PFEHGRGDRGQSVRELRLGTRAAVEPPADVDAATRERPPRPDDDGVCLRVGGEGIERLGAADAEAAPLTGREPPVGAVCPERLACLVDDLPGRRRRVEARPLEERAVVVAPEEARLLALRTGCDGETAGAGVGARLRLRLLAEREPEAVEECCVERR